MFPIPSGTLLAVDAERIFNSDLTLKSGERPCIIFFHEIVSPCSPSYQRDRARNIETYRAVQKSASSSPYRIYSVAVTAGSRLDMMIKNGTSAIPTFYEYPQLVLYVQGIPRAFLNGRLMSPPTVAVGFHNAQLYVHQITGNQYNLQFSNEGRSFSEQSSEQSSFTSSQPVIAVPEAEEIIVPTSSPIIPTSSSVSDRQSVLIADQLIQRPIEDTTTISDTLTSSPLRSPNTSRSPNTLGSLNTSIGRPVRDPSLRLSQTTTPTLSQVPSQSVRRSSAIITPSQPSRTVVIDGYTYTLAQ